MKIAKGVVLLGICVSLITYGNNTISHAMTTPEVPDNLKPPKTEKVSLSLAARGFQIYECQVTKEDATKFEWVFKAPEAELFESSNKQVGKHYAGPTWESIDGSKVSGEVKAKADSIDATAIPWLLLTAKRNEGQGVFSHVRSIQRIDTVEGKAPVLGCNQSNLNKLLKVEYSANYYFYADQP